MIEDPYADLQASFVRYFSDPRAARIDVTQRDLALLAEGLPSTLPARYVQFLSEHGPVRCPTILRLVLEFDMEHPDLREFLSPAQALQRSRDGWKRELPADLFVFATDCMGNPFCFPRSLDARQEAPVFFLSPQHEGPISLTESFDDLLRWYVEHVRQVPVPLKS